MCGRCAMTVERGCMERIAGTSRWRDNGGASKVQPKYNASPYDSGHFMPVVVGEADGSTSLAGMRWGLCPSYARDEREFRKYTFNAKAEGLTTSPMWRRCLTRNRRCICILQGIYEWGEAKRPRFIQSGRGVKPFTLASPAAVPDTAPHAADTPPASRPPRGTDARSTDRTAVGVDASSPAVGVETTPTARPCARGHTWNPSQGDVPFVCHACRASLGGHKRHRACAGCGVRVCLPCFRAAAKVVDVDSDAAGGGECVDLVKAVDAFPRGSVVDVDAADGHGCARGGVPSSAATAAVAATAPRPVTPRSSGVKRARDAAESAAVDVLAGLNLDADDEWVQANAGKPFPLLAAGLYDQWWGWEEGRDPDTGAQKYPLESVTILTMDPPPRTDIAAIHDRMPVLLTDADSARAWLHQATAEEVSAPNAPAMTTAAGAPEPFETMLARIMQKARGMSFHIYEVGPAVGKSTYESPDCVLSADALRRQTFERNLGRFFTRSPKRRRRGEGQPRAGATAEVVID